MFNFKLLIVISFVFVALPGCSLPPLFLSAGIGDHARAKTLLDQGVPIDEYWMGQTPLMNAVTNGQTEMVRLLLDRGANINAGSQAAYYQGWTALMFAVDKGDIPTVQLLLERGADTEARSTDNLIASYNKNALQMALERGNTIIARMITEATENRFVKTAKPIPEKPPARLKFIFSLPRTNLANRDAVAVIIGNRDYQKGTPNVDFAHNDAALIRRYVVESLGYREGNVIDLRNATQADFVSVFGNERNYKGQLHNWLRPNESDVFVYYSGHGAPGLSTGQSYLLPVDANPNALELNGYPLETLYENLGKLPAKSLTVIIDACFSGNSQAGMVVKNASPAMLKVVETRASLPNATVITASDVSEVASWDEETNLGLFTRHFIEGVTGKADQDKFGNGDGRITLGELKSYLEGEVSYMARRLYMRDQHPQVSGRSEMILNRP